MTHWSSRPRLHCSAHGPGVYVGRIGALALALGVGTAVAGFFAACAQADTGDSAASKGASARTSTSQSVNVGIRKTARVNAASALAGTARTTAPAAHGAMTKAAVSQLPSAPDPTAPVASEIVSVQAPLSAVLPQLPMAPTDTVNVAMMATVRRPRIASAAVGVVAAATAATPSVEGEKMLVLQSGGGRVITDRTASGGSALALTSSATASTTVVLPGSTALVIRAKATVSWGAPTMTFSIDGVPVTTVVVNTTSWSNYTFTGVVPAGSHVLSISSSNVTSRQSLCIDTVTATTGSFVDEFIGKAGSAPSSANWSIKTGSGWDPGLENYQTSNVTLDGKGNLVIQATKRNSRYASGWVETKNKVSFGYGTITARIKVPSGQGLWPAFWLKGANEDTVPWPQSGEIDVLELPSTTTTIYSTLHGPITGSTNTEQANVITNVPDLSSGYHDFWVRHLPDLITFGVDNQILGTLTPASLIPGSQWVYNQPMFAIINMAVGGSWAGAPNALTKFPAAMNVAWIRWDPPSN